MHKIVKQTIKNVGEALKTNDFNVVTDVLMNSVDMEDIIVAASEMTEEEKAFLAGLYTIGAAYELTTTTSRKNNDQSDDAIQQVKDMINDFLGEEAIEIPIIECGEVAIVTEKEATPGVIVNFKKLHPDAVAPKKGTVASAGLDLSACFDDGVKAIVIEPGETVKIKTGIAVEIPDGYFGGVYARSGLSTKQGLRPANCVGVVDADYRGDVTVPLYNDSSDPQVINHGDRVAQLVIMPYLQVNLVEVDTLGATGRGDGGFGSTGGNN